MSKSYVRWDGFRVAHQGENQGEGRYVSLGWLCSKTESSDTDPQVQIFHEPGKGYTFKRV